MQTLNRCAPSGNVSVCPAREKYRAFTLVELLVVIGIIAVLISILLPSLNLARKQAVTVKCLSNLRQIGNAFALYANDNKGVWPVSVWRDEIRSRNYFFNNGTDDPATTTPRNWYWHQFIQKYLNSKAARDTNGGASNAISARGYITSNNLLWGCGEWRPWEDASFTGGINLDEVGYGMNWAPTYRANFPTVANPDPSTVVQDGVPAGSPQWQNRAYNQTWGTTSTTSTRKPGRFFKVVEWREPADRALISDSEYFATAMDTAPLADGTPQPQVAHIYQQYGANNIDFFRHGKPGKNINNTYDMKSGKPKINILYCDGRAATVNTYGDVYRAFRRRFPG